MQLEQKPSPAGSSRADKAIKPATNGAHSEGTKRRKETRQSRLPAIGCRRRWILFLHRAYKWFRRYLGSESPLTPRASYHLSRLHARVSSTPMRCATPHYTSFAFVRVRAGEKRFLRVSSTTFDTLTTFVRSHWSLWPREIGVSLVKVAILLPTRV